jgi:lipoprotein-releasing system permease protein
VTTLAADLTRGAQEGGAAAPGLDALRPARPADGANAGDPATVFLGRELAFNLGVRVGDRVQLIVPRARLSPFSVRPKSVTYEVAGTPDSGFFDYDTSRVYLHLHEAQRLFGLGAATTAMQVRCDAEADVALVRARLQAALGDGLWVTDLIEQNRAFFAALRTEKLVSFLVIGLIMLVAALNIASTLILMVMEKVRDIGALLSMGATSRGVMAVFLLQGAIIGVVGTAGGCVLGVGAAWVMDTYRLWALDPDVYFIDYLPFKVRILDFVGTAAVALGISFVATLYPAWRASRLDPVEALRNE